MLFPEKTSFDLLVFCIWQSDLAYRYFWLSYFLNNFSLLDGLSRFFWFIDGIQLLHLRPAECTFPDKTCSSITAFNDTNLRGHKFSRNFLFTILFPNREIKFRESY